MQLDGVTELSRATIKGGVRFVKSLALFSIAMLTAAVLIYFSNQSIQSRWLDVFALALMAVPCLLWLAFAIPVFQVAESAVENSPGFFKRTLGLFGGILCVLVFIAVWTLRFPPSLVGFEIYGCLLALLISLMVLGVRPGPKAIAGSVALGSLVPLFFVVMPRTANSFVPQWTNFDAELADSVNASNEIELTYDTLLGRTRQKFFQENGEPLAWCIEDRFVPAGFRCFDAEGADRITGQTLVPFSRDIRARAVQNLSASGSDQLIETVSPSDPKASRPNPCARLTPGHYQLIERLTQEVADALKAKEDVGLTPADKLVAELEYASAVQRLATVRKNIRESVGLAEGQTCS